MTNAQKFFIRAGFIIAGDALFTTVSALFWWFFVNSFMWATNDYADWNWKMDFILCFWFFGSFGAAIGGSVANDFIKDEDSRIEKKMLRRMRVIREKRDY